MTRLTMLLAPVLLGLGGLAVAACAPMEGGPAAPPPPADGPSECKADLYQAYIGRKKSDLPAAPAGETWRVACSTCAVTMDYNPRRLTITYDVNTEVVTQMACG